MKKIIITILILILTCNTYSQNSKIPKAKYKINVNSFLNDKKIPQLAKDLFLEKIGPTDSDENLSLIDSINSRGNARGFYFLTITKTMKYADGAYSEPLGEAAKEYVEKNTMEFLSYFFDNKDLLTKQDFNNWAIMVYGEIQIVSEGNEKGAVNELKKIMMDNCKGLSHKFYESIEEFIGRMK